MWYTAFVILEFKSADTKMIFEGNISKAYPPEIQGVALRKLLQLHAAIQLQDLRFPRGNRLEQLSKDRLGQHSIRINKQWRVCFVWKDGNAHQVEITDYH